MSLCPWCGHPDDCRRDTPGRSPHHDLCCLDRDRPACRTTDPALLGRILREHRAVTS